MTLRADSSGDPADSALATFSFPDTWTPSALNTFELQTSANLDSDTTYHIHIATTQRVWAQQSAASQVDAGSASEWSFSARGIKNSDGDWEARTNALTMELHGTIKPLPPGAPTGLTATAGHHVVKLDWTAPADDGGSPITGYEYRTIDLEGQTAVPTGSTSRSHIVDTVVALNGGYAIRVRAVNAAGSGDWSNVVSGQLGPASVQIVGRLTTTVTIEGADAMFTLIASKPALSSSKPLNVSVSVSESGDMVASADEGAQTVSFALDETTAVLLVPTADDGVAEDDSAVTVAIQTDADYTVGASSSGTVTVTDAETTPGAPTGITATEGHRVVQLEWTAPANDGGSPITGYEGRFTFGGFAESFTLGDSTSYTLGDPSSLVTVVDGVHTFEVRAVNASEYGRVVPSDDVHHGPGHGEPHRHRRRRGGGGHGRGVHADGVQGGAVGGQAAERERVGIGVGGPGGLRPRGGRGR